MSFRAIGGETELMRPSGLSRVDLEAICKDISAYQSGDQNYCLSTSTYDDDLPAIYSQLVGAVFLQEVLVGADTKLLKDGLVYNIETSNASGEETVSYSSITGSWFEGYTFVANHLQKYVAEFADIHTHYYKNFNADLNFNAYWSPPLSTGAGMHDDDHDVMVLQLAGSKRWDIVETDGSVSDVLLEAGDSLFVRKGVFHNPVSLGKGSLHVTIGLHKQDSLHTSVGLYEPFNKMDVESHNCHTPDQLPLSRIFDEACHLYQNNEPLSTGKWRSGTCCEYNKGEGVITFTNGVGKSFKLRDTFLRSIFPQVLPNEELQPECFSGSKPLFIQLFRKHLILPCIEKAIDND